MPKSCCAVGCSNHNMMNPLTVTFHQFPSDPERFERWVNACKRLNADGTKWRPGKHQVLCSAHFVSGKPNKDPNHPDYVPSVFSFHSRSLEKGTKSLSRYNSAVKRKISFETPSTKRVAFQEVDLNRGTSEDTASASDLLLPYPLTPATATPGPAEEMTPLLHKQSPEFTATLYTPVMDLGPASLKVDGDSNAPVLVDDKDTQTDGCPSSRPMDDEERGALYDELYVLRKEKEELQAEVTKLQLKIASVKLGALTVEGDDEKCKHYTGVSWDVFMTIYTYLSTFIKPSGSRIELRDQLFLTLVKLRLNIPFEFMGTHAGVSTARMSQIFWTWVDLMAAKLDFLVHWPDRETLKQTLPGVFKEKFPRLTSIIDCFEIFIDRPRNLKARAQSYSNYKKHSTVKVFIACSPLGSVSFLSAAWGGRVSDIEIVRESGFIDPKYHLPGDQILADRGFTLQDDFAASCGAELIIPAFTKGKDQLSAQEVEVSRKISSVRIHIERVIGLLKNRYTILQGTMPIQMIKCLTDEVSEIARIDKLLRVCASLTNLGEGIVYSEKGDDEDDSDDYDDDDSMI